MQALPHRPEWLMTSVLLLLAAVGMLASGAARIVPFTLFALGAAGTALTLVKCTVYGWQSDIDGLPMLRARGPAASRLIYRTTIAWLHVVQPFARAYGFVRGLLRPPRSSQQPMAETNVAAEAPSGVPQHHLALLNAGECRFWSEHWTSAEALLTRIVDRLRAVRLGRGVHVDDGWRADRDISIGVGVWGWAHMRALVEDHGAGKCLFRARLQLRLRFGTVLLLSFAAVLVALTAPHGFQAVAAPFAAALLLATKIVHDVTRDAGDMLDALAAAAEEFGMQPVAGRVSHPSDASSWTRLTRPEPTHGA
jgi:hypothetical protein